MTFNIGFTGTDGSEKKPSENICTEQHTETLPRKSVVQVLFQGSNRKLAYYNDKFDLHCGDFVYVEGKLEGERGRVIDVNYNFKIKISDYKRVISVADTAVHGRFYMAGSHFVTFDRNVLPKNKVITWFRAPLNDDGEFVSGSDDTAFRLDDINDMNVNAEISGRGYDYYLNNKVRYINIDGIKGYAIVEGTKNYEVEFEYHNGEIRSLVCSCFCSYNCKHEFAVMLQLKEMIKLIEKHYANEYAENDYFAAIEKSTLFAFAVADKESGFFTL